MVRTMHSEENTLYRAVVVTVTTTGDTRETAYGPYTTLAAARNIGSRQVSHIERYGRGANASVRYESTNLNWVPVN